MFRARQGARHVSARALTGFPVVTLNSGVMNLDRTCHQPDGVSLKVFGDNSGARLDVIAERITCSRATQIQGSPNTWAWLRVIFMDTQMAGLT
jgi:hypothetical protein